MNKILIGIPTAEYARRADFYDYLNGLIKPDGTYVFMSHGQSPARNRNLMIKYALEQNCTHVMFIDDDTAFPPDMLMKLLAHDVDIVTGLYLMRNFPHQPIIFDSSMEDGRCAYHFLDNNEKGLIEILNCGLGSCLIKTHVFKAIEEPWIRLGELEKDHWCDDIGFFNRVRAKGFKIHCDLDCPVGHVASMIIWPDRVDGKWMTVYDTSGKGRVSFPAINAKELPNA